VPGLPIRKRKGHLAITDRRPGLVRHQLVELGYLKSAHTVAADSVAFNVQPRRSGQIIVGSSRQFGDEETAVNPAILAAMLERAKLYLPELEDCVLVRTWTGFRAATPDKLPLIGPWPADASVLLATGHEGLGITTSLGTARLIADQVMGATAEIPVEPYWPERLVGAGVTRGSETHTEGR
jgi:D-hydroxyproline dehydrogenase subunit beta